MTYTKPEEAKKLWKEIKRRGNMTKKDVLLFINAKTNCADAFLATMETHGYLLSEGKNGVLYPYRSVND